MVYQVLPEGHEKARQQSKRQQERLSCGEQSELPEVGLLVSHGGVPNRMAPGFALHWKCYLCGLEEPLKMCPFPPSEGKISGRQSDGFRWMFWLEPETTQWLCVSWSVQALKGEEG